MPRSSITPGSAQDWLTRAKGDLALARAPLPEGAFYQDLCFHSHQAAEKATKAVYRHYGWKFRYTHDLNTLFTGLMKKAIDIPPAILEADILTGFAWEARYPGFGEPVTKEEFLDALVRAETVVNWAGRLIETSDD